MQEQKDFDTWNEEKKIINIRQDTATLFFEELKTWLHTISTYSPYDKKLANEVKDRINYLKKIINKYRNLNKRFKIISGISLEDI